MWQIPQAMLAWFILAVTILACWAPLGVERRAGGTREYLGVFSTVIVAWNYNELALRGDETLVFNKRLALIVRPWAVVPLVLTGTAVYIAYRVLKAGRPQKKHSSSQDDP